MSLPSVEERPLLTPDEVLASIDLPFSRATLYRMIASGEVPTRRWGRRIYIVNSELREKLGITAGSAIARQTKRAPVHLEALSTTHMEPITVTQNTSRTPDPKPLDQHSDWFGVCTCTTYGHCQPCRTALETRPERRSDLVVVDLASPRLVHAMIRLGVYMGAGPGFAAVAFGEFLKNVGAETLADLERAN